MLNEGGEAENARLALAVDLDHLVDGVDKHQCNEDERDLETILDLCNRRRRISRTACAKSRENKRTFAMMSARPDVSECSIAQVDQGTHETRRWS